MTDPHLLDVSARAEASARDTGIDWYVCEPANGEGLFAVSGDDLPLGADVVYIAEAVEAWRFAPKP